MTFTVRRVSGWLKAKPAYLLPIFILLCVQGTYAQQKLETQQQANEKIQELAGLARTQPVDTPIGAGDLLHVDVFDVPELSRDLRVSDMGDITYPSNSREDSNSHADCISIGTKIGATPGRKRLGIASAGFRFRKGAAQSADLIGGRGAKTDGLSGDPADDVAGIACGGRRDH